MIIILKEIGVIASVITALSFIIASIIALITIRINNKLRRSDLLNSLFEKFFYQDKYAEIRKHIDYSNKHDDLIKQLDEALAKHNNEEL